MVARQPKGIETVVDRPIDVGRLHPVTNGAEAAIAYERPYEVTAVMQGSTAFLFHRWNNEAVAEKAAAVKGSKAKKTDNIASYVYRMKDGDDTSHLGIPGEYFRQSIILAAKYRQDPRSPRKSAMDLYKAGVVTLTEIADLGQADWDYLDSRRVVVQRNAITRVRPALFAGWKATVRFAVLLPEYIPPQMLLEVLQQAGRLVGVGDNRPTYGRFNVVKWDVHAG